MTMTARSDSWIDKLVFDRIGVPKRFGAVRQKKQKKGGAEA